jgi:hypothetical protein
MLYMRVFCCAVKVAVSGVGDDRASLCHASALAES